MKISATIITYNEEENIREACERLAWADEIIVVDSGSTDKTREIAETHGARVISRQWAGSVKKFRVQPLGCPVTEAAS